MGVALYNEHLGERDGFIQDNLRLVHKVCQRYKGRAQYLGIDYEEIASEGTIGLIRAYDKFDPTKFEGGGKIFNICCTYDYRCGTEVLSGF